MKVLVVADSLAPSDGPGRYARGLLSELRSRVDRIEIALPRDHGAAVRSEEAMIQVDAVLRVLPSRHLYYLRPLFFFPLVLLAALRLMPAARRADVVHAVKDYPFSLVAALAAAFARRPLVVTVYGTFAILPLDSRHHRLAARYVYRRAAQVFCISRYTAERLESRLREEELSRLEVVAPGVDARFFTEEKDLESSHPPFLLSVGLVRERKGLDVSVAAFLQIAEEEPNLEYRIVGDCPPSEIVDRLRTMVSAHPAGRRVHFLGQVEDAELLALYASCELFLLTPRQDSLGRFEGLGLVYAEAGAAGKAVIGTTGCGAEDAIEDGVTGLLVAPGDVRATSDGLRELLADPEARRAMGAAGRRRAAANTWKQVAERVHDSYEGAQRRSSREGA